ncbi:MAG: hypothetical protein OEZ20_09195 [candidate division WOR-3 bacterium]|nr:hypothetical protein [candidate division WOR-3 bacterium]
MRLKCDGWSNHSIIDETRFVWLVAGDWSPVPRSYHFKVSSKSL